MRRRNRARAAGCAGAFDARFGSAWLALTGVVLPGLLPVLGVGIGGGAFWTALGWPLARRVLPADIPVLCGAPALGWCVHTALSLSVLPLMAFDRWHVVLVAWLVACPMIGLAMQGGGSDTRAPWWLAACAGVVALGPMAGVLPHLAGGVVSLSMPMFDHSKIAIVDAVAREGVPAANAFYGGGEAGAHLTYYWWWHASAAEVARVAGVSGWAADAALTWFTAAASMLLMAGIAWGLGGRGAAVLAMLISLPGSLHPWLGWLEQAGWLRGGSGLGGWLNQASWAPQHLAAGSALVVAALLLAGWADGAVLVRSVSLGCVVAAAFGSSVWVGGVTCAVALPVAAAVVLRRLPAAARPRAILWSVLAAAMALALVAGLVRDEWAGARLRGGGLPVMLAPYPVFGTAVPGWLRPIADAGGFAWLLLIEFPGDRGAGRAGGVAGCAGGGWLARRVARAGRRGAAGGGVAAEHDRQQ